MYRPTVELSTFQKLQLHFSRQQVQVGQWVTMNGEKWQVHCRYESGVILRKLQKKVWLRNIKQYNCRYTYRAVDCTVSQAIANASVSMARVMGVL